MALFLCIRAHDVVEVRPGNKILSDHTSSRDPRPQLGLFIRTSNPGDVYIMNDGSTGATPFHIVRLGREFKEKV